MNWMLFLDRCKVLHSSHYSISSCTRHGPHDHPSQARCGPWAGLLHYCFTGTISAYAWHNFISVSQNHQTLKTDQEHTTIKCDSIHVENITWHLEDSHCRQWVWHSYVTVSFNFHHLLSLKQFGISAVHFLNTTVFLVRLVLIQK